MASMSVVQPLRPEWPARSSNRAFGLEGLAVLLLRKEGGAQLGVEREVDTVAGAGGPKTSHTSKLQPHSLISNLIMGLNLLSGLLTFSSIPPLTTGSGRGPAWVRNNRGTRGQTGGKLGCQVGIRFIQRPPGEREAPLCGIKSAAHLSFQRHPLCYIVEA